MVFNWPHTGRLRKRDNLLSGEGEGEEPNYNGEKACSSRNNSRLSAILYFSIHYAIVWTYSNSESNWYLTAKNQYPPPPHKIETNIPRKGLARPKSQFPHSRVSLSEISHDRSAYIFSYRKYVDWFWEYINRSQTHECGNWDLGCAIPRNWIHK